MKTTNNVSGRVGWSWRCSLDEGSNIFSALSIGIERSERGREAEGCENNKRINESNVNGNKNGKYNEHEAR